ncbi:HD domain-containing protein [Fibrivirga algicola]|uniref:HD-CE domain-containing protein n=1 Tax=Fibrivirga algicola TaxID=2950420 RepID=A0ABX0Q9T2_9BACT|nr:ATP-binding protein [Fibrivirga algicola]NID08935.1 hypothetical protein [Fibrivirga algicola]
MDKNITELNFFKELARRNSHLVHTFEEVYEESATILNNRIPVVFATYTLHNIQHSNRIMDIMYEFINDITKISDLEIIVLCYSALLHDIGMAVWDTELDQIRQDKYVSSKGNYSAYLKYYENEGVAIQEFVRNIHAERSSKYIKDHLSDKLHLPNQPTNNFTEEVALICQSHTESIDWITKKLSNHIVKGDYNFNPQYCASLLRMADILDIDTQRTPYKLYELINPKSISDEEWRQHFVISNNNKIEIDIKTNNKKIVFYGTCDNPSIHRKVLSYIDWVQLELSDCIKLTEKMDLTYNINFNPIIENNITPKGYTFSDHKMALNFKAISNLLMGKNIYGSEHLGLREIVQNAIDACEVRAEEERNRATFGDDYYIATIKIIINKKENTVTIKDNGTGMTIDTIKNHFLSIGSSYYSSKNFKLKGYSYQPIGNYGIGFLSCFMLSPTVRLSTRYYLSNDRYDVDLEHSSEYTSISEREDISFSGTEIVLNYSTFMEAFDNSIEEVSIFLKTYFITDNLNIKLIDLDHSQIYNIENNLTIDHNLGKDEYIIDISRYLDNVTGHIIVAIKSNFIKYSSDAFQNDTYIYDSESDKFIKLDESVDLKDFIFNGKLAYLEVPIISSSYKYDYEQALDYYDGDGEKALRRIKEGVKLINILMNEKQIKEVKTGFMSSNSLVFNDLHYEKFQELGQCSNCEVIIEKKFIPVFHIPNIPEVFIYNRRVEIPELFSFRPSRNSEIFLRKVYISKHSYRIPFEMPLFKLISLKINVIDKRVLPDVSRNNLNESIIEDFNYTLSKAIYLGVLHNSNFTIDQKNLLESFIQLHFSKRSFLEKQDN